MPRETRRESSLRLGFELLLRSRDIYDVIDHVSYTYMVILILDTTPAGGSPSAIYSCSHGNQPGGTGTRQLQGTGPVPLNV